MQFVRFLGTCVLLAVLGVGIAKGIEATTDIHRLVPEDWARVYVGVGCGYSEKAADLVLRARPAGVALIPIDTGVSEKERLWCAYTVEQLVAAGYWWLAVPPDEWLCRRAARAGDGWVREHSTGGRGVPLFARGDKTVASGLRRDSFERLGVPELVRAFATAEVGEGRPTMSMQGDAAGKAAEEHAERRQSEDSDNDPFETWPE